MNAAMDDLAAKTAGGRKATTELDQAQNKLSNDWQDMATQIGPPLLQLFDQVLEGADGIYQSLLRLGQDDGWWHSLNDGLINVLRTAQRVMDVLNGLRSLGTGNIQGVESAISDFTRASGGPVVAGRPYVIGEEGPELFVPGQSGAVVPNDLLKSAGSMTAARPAVVGTSTADTSTLSVLRDILTVNREIRDAMNQLNADAAIPGSQLAQQAAGGG